MSDDIPFSLPYIIGNEINYINDALRKRFLSGERDYTIKCKKWLVENLKTLSSHITPSCTSSLEMSAVLMNIKAGDEIIMPSFTFTSTANAFLLMGATPVFVDIRTDTLNIDENLIEQAITKKTKAIVVVHYAGVSCEMDAIISLAKKYKIYIIEDAAQGLCASYKSQKLGSIGHMGCISFHETKNIQCGEGGALLVNNEKFIERAEIIREKGTNRSMFYKGKIKKYNWVDIGSSYLLNELSAAFLFAQLESSFEITKERLKIWNRYQEMFSDLEETELIRRPIIPVNCKHNGHIYYLLLNKKFCRDNILKKLKANGVNAVFHYQPLHSSPAGLKYGRTESPLNVTEEISERLIRLPIWIGFKEHERVKEALEIALN